MNEKTTIYFDDMALGDRFEYGPYRVAEDELVEFNTKWDPLPIHLHDDAAQRRGLKAKTASGQYTLSVKQYFVSRTPFAGAVIGAMGFDEVRFPHPVYVGDELRLTIEVTALRPSRSKPDRGIVTFDFRMSNQDGVDVLTYVDTVMFSRRSAP